MTFPYDTRLPPDLRALKVEIEAHARAFGLDFYETIFEVVEADDLNEIASYGGFPTRYPHWSFGMSYEELKKGYEYGLSKIYEMVINNDPCYAYLMRCNHTVDQKLVMAHVYGHCDFFKNNAYFAHTSRKMMDEMANHGVRIRRYAEKYGEDEVEAFVDRCMSVDDLIDLHAPAIKRREEHSRYDFKEAVEEEQKLTRFQSKDYMSDYINPPEALRAEEAKNKKDQQAIDRSFPERPEKDVLLFLIEYGPLKPWQRDILSIIRDEAYYFAPQGQTKILNEGWACLVKNSLIFTERGLLLLGDLVSAKTPATVHDGETTRPIYDWASFENRETVKLRTRRGFEVEGSTNHRLLLPSGGWRQLDAFKIGDGVRLGVGTDLWAENCVEISRKPRKSLVLVGHGANNDEMETDVSPIRIPERMDESLSKFLGFLSGKNCISGTGRGIRFVTGEKRLADEFCRLSEELFGLETEPRIRGGGQWSVHVRSPELCEFAIDLGLRTTMRSRKVDVPTAILRSPKAVVAAYLQALVDNHACVNHQGIEVILASEPLSKTIQLVLLNFGIVSERYSLRDAFWRLRIAGPSAAIFSKEIAFGLESKQKSLRNYLKTAGDAESWEDEIVAIERGRADVFDVSVAQTHRYAAQGFINHNSFWHSTIMTERALEAWECIDYADHHSGTMAMSRGRINPYKLGIELLRDVERRWNMGQFGKEWEECENLEKKRTWNLNLGLGRKKIFEVRKIHNDVTFIDTFLTPEFCREHKMFSFAHNEPQNNYVIESREFQKVKQRLLFSLTNHGRPFIYVTDGNYKNRGELLLLHEYNGIELRMDRAIDTLANLQALWSRPVHLQTIVDDRPVVITHDGTSPSQKNLGEADDPRKHAPSATK